MCDASNVMQASGALKSEAKCPLAHLLEFGVFADEVLREAMPEGILGPILDLSAGRQSPLPRQASNLDL
jgi:hypothetical protein